MFEAIGIIATIWFAVMFGIFIFHLPRALMHKAEYEAQMATRMEAEMRSDRARHAR